MTSLARPLPAPATFLELLKPVTWFPPMWAFACGVVSVGGTRGVGWVTVAAGVLLAGPMVCGTSQAVNDWYDRHVDAINEPARPIPSGRMPGRWGLAVAVIWSAASLVLAAVLGPAVLVAAIVALLLAWAYSAPPFRLKNNGWFGNAAVAICYEGLPWFTGAAVACHGLPTTSVVLLALLYSVGAHGIMTLNDFKAVEGDIRTGVRSLPVQLGIVGAARWTCFIMAVPQLAVVALLVIWGLPIAATLVAGLSLAQFSLMQRFLQRPRERALWFSAVGVSLYVSGMMVAAVALSLSGLGR